IIVVLLATRLPESPTFAAMREVRRRRASGDTAGAEALAAEHDLEEAAHHATGVKDVFTPELRRHTTCLSLAWFFNWMAIQVFSVLGSTILVEAKGVSFDNALLILVLSNAVGFVGYVFHGWLGDQIGRKWTVAIGWVAGGVASLAMLLGPGTAGFIIPLYALTLFFLTGPYAALLFYMGESYPPQVRGMGANVAHVMAPLGGIAGSGLLTILLTVGVDTGLAAIITGTGGLLVSALCMAGTRTLRDAHQKSTVFA
ncbi:MAG TPA: MFS transporter, partial [Blastococcus sp.]